jgi:hypothetical protein
MKETPISKDGLAQKLRALQNMTVANGCTESEALVAAAKAAELLEHYGLSLEELKAAAPDQVCDSDSVDCGRRHCAKRTAAGAGSLSRSPLDMIWIPLAS